MKSIGNSFFRIATRHHTATKPGAHLACHLCQESFRRSRAIARNDEPEFANVPLASLDVSVFSMSERNGPPQGGSASAGASERKPGQVGASLKRAMNKLAPFACVYGRGASTTDAFETHLSGITRVHTLRLLCAQANPLRVR